MLKKLVSAILSVAVSFMLTGCAGNQDLKQKVIVESVGIDFTKDEFTVSVLYFKPQGSDSSSDQKTQTASVKAKSLGEAFSIITSTIGKDPFYANNRIVILGKEAVSQRLDEIIDFIIRDSDMREDCYLLWSKNAGETIKNEKLSASDNNYIFTLLQKNVQNGNCAALTAMMAAVNIQMGLGDVFMPHLEQQNKELFVSGTVLFQKDKNLATIDRENGFYLSLVLNQLHNPTMSVQTDNGAAAVKILYADTDIKTSDISEGLIDISVTVRCTVAERERYTVTDEMINSAVESTLKSGINDLLFLTAEQGTDVIGLTKVLRKHNKDYYEAYKNSPQKMISSLSFTVTAGSQIMRTGRKTD